MADVHQERDVFYGTQCFTFYQAFIPFILMGYIYVAVSIYKDEGTWHALNEMHMSTSGSSPAISPESM
jgi:hypothetical protein